jgi:signal transduction histidine kinase
VEARLARWLLAVADRVDTGEFRLSQEFMAQMLGVHRPTVSVTLQKLRDAGVLTSQGRTFKVSDRVGLERLACECYRVLRREFDRLRHPPVVSLDAWPQVIDRIGTREIESIAVETMREISGRLLLASIGEQEARDQAEAANRAKDQVLALVSHELRARLNAILALSTALEERPHELANGLHAIRDNTEALLKLVDELLDAARRDRAGPTLATDCEAGAPR